MEKKTELIESELNFDELEKIAGGTAIDWVIPLNFRIHVLYVMRL